MQMCFKPNIGELNEQMCHISRINFICILIALFCCVFADDNTKSAWSSQTKDASDVTWAHAVNNRQSLEYELKNDVKFLEADVSMGHVTNGTSGPNIPIMAHPPDVISDISLDSWLDIVANSDRDKGVKLDFKSLDSVEPSLLLLKKFEEKISFPLWLNADVIPGPIDSTTNPVAPDEFLRLCRQHFPNATLSLGWTTSWHPTMPPDTWHYEWQHIRSMVDAIFCKNKAKDKQNLKVTFAVRGIFAARSIEMLQWLVDVVPGSSLTVWSGKYDPLDVQDLLHIRSAFLKSQVYYDVPDLVKVEFTSRKKEAPDYVVPTQTFANHNWMMVTRGKSSDLCTSFSYVNDNAVLFGASLTTAVLLKDSFVLGRGARLQVRGYVTFLQDLSEQKQNQELVLILADVSVFSKNSSSDFASVAGDSDVIWSAMNSSRLHVFRNDGRESSCHLFQLDTAMDKAFQAWALPCDVMYEENTFEDDVKVGKQEVSSRKRLVLPAGPVLFGFMAAGEQHTVVHRLGVLGQTKADVASTTSSVKTSNWLFLGLCLSLSAFVLV